MGIDPLRFRSKSIPMGTYSRKYKFAATPAGIAQLVECQTLGCEVLGSNLPWAFPKVTMGSTLVVARNQSLLSGSLSACKSRVRAMMDPTFETNGQSELNQSPKQRLPVVPLNGGLSPQKNFKKQEKQLNPSV